MTESPNLAELINENEINEGEDGSETDSTPCVFCVHKNSGMVEEIIDTPAEYSLLKRAKSFSYAWRGLKVFVKTTPNAQVQIAIFGLVIALGLYFAITKIEWIILVFASGFVLVSEAFNTAIEIDVNLTSPHFHPYAKDIKDVAAGAVLLSAIVVAIIGLFIFTPYFSIWLKFITG